MDRRRRRRGTAVRRAKQNVRGQRRQGGQGVVTAVVDADYAGCDETIRSTSGGALKLGHHCVRSWNAKQQVAALPTGEAELYGVVEGAGVLIGAISMMRDLVLSVKGVLQADSYAAKGKAP